MLQYWSTRLSYLSLTQFRRGVILYGVVWQTDVDSVSVYRDAAKSEREVRSWVTSDGVTLSVTGEIFREVLTEILRVWDELQGFSTELLQEVESDEGVDVESLWYARYPDYSTDTRGYDPDKKVLTYGVGLTPVVDTVYQELVQHTLGGGKLSHDAMGLPTKDLPPSAYHTWSEGGWSISKGGYQSWLEEKRRVGQSLINDEVESTISPLTRFSLEYTIRETQAATWRDEGFSGEPPEQVIAFASPAGLDPKSAAERILTQAENLRSVLNVLGALRMRKFELNQLETVEEVEATTSEIVAAIKGVGARLT